MAVPYSCHRANAMSSAPILITQVQNEMARCLRLLALTVADRRGVRWETASPAPSPSAPPSSSTRSVSVAPGSMPPGSMSLGSMSPDDDSSDRGTSASGTTVAIGDLPNPFGRHRGNPRDRNAGAVGGKRHPLVVPAGASHGQ